MKKLIKLITEKLNNKISTDVDKDYSTLDEDKLYIEIRLCEMIEILEQGGELESLQLEFFVELQHDIYMSEAMSELECLIEKNEDEDEDEDPEDKLEYLLEYYNIYNEIENWDYIYVLKLIENGYYSRNLAELCDRMRLY